MINKLEIEEKSKEFEISEVNVERDYVFSWIIFGLFEVSSLRETIFLKGGNALRKGYFENTRYSSDLDFGIPNDPGDALLLEEMNKICDFINERTGISFLKSKNKIEEKFVATDIPIHDLKVYEIKVYFNDFYGRSDCTIKISMDMTRFDKTLLPIQSVPLIHPYSDADELRCYIRCMKLEEIIATKLKCLLQRQHSPDLFDYVHSIKLLGGTLDREEVVKTFIRKTIFGKDPHLVKDILQKTPLDHTKIFWGKILVCAKTTMFTAEEAIETFINDLEDLFKIFPNRSYGSQFTYFPPELRIPIMQAGRDQTLLKVKYNGSYRMIEPYSLKYKEKKDGAQREYFYLYNRTGGDSPPGMRSFLPSGFESIENTDEKFTPRCLIELSKAGDILKDRFLFDPNKPEKSPRPKPHRSFSRIKYIYKCIYCGRNFPKNKRDANLKAHKSKNRYNCNGRRGYYIDTKY